MFGRRRSAGDRDRGRARHHQAAEELTEATETAGRRPARATGPWDVAEPHPELPRVDLGSLQVPVLEGTDIQLVFAEQHGAWVTVRHQLSETAAAGVRRAQAVRAVGRGARRDRGRDRRRGRPGRGARGPVRHRAGRARPAEPGKPAAGVRPIRFAGVDGPRWFLRGLFAGAAAADPAAAAPLEAVLREVVVVRGDHPMPPRDLLELQAAAGGRRPPSTSRPAPSRAEQEQEQNRFNTAPNPFQRGPEMTETR